ncbi:hypothetical protein IQ06DRAFT_218420 [Phaeosphaeriaceae sp. SRC1lsM3a]|nr:hypothetical protein IQ06DRAFT_218420 [Stagonospora sp. SRC1lsM3a]
MITTSTVLPPSNSPWLRLVHPTSDELLAIANDTAPEWSDSLPLSKYLEESKSMTDAPLARNKGMTQWILVDSRLAPNQRQILSSCESFRKRALASTNIGGIRDVIIQGIASVFCAPRYRGHGYAQRMMSELRRELRNWQLDGMQCVGSILYSDIGRDYYSKLGWTPHIHNTHVELRATKVARSPVVQDVLAEDIPALCEEDEIQLRRLLSMPPMNQQTRMAIVPDMDHIGWHLAKEEFACDFLFGEVPKNKGAVAGPKGSRVWVLWNHRYYDHPDKNEPNNVLYILRLVVEGDATYDDASDAEGNYVEQKRNLQAVIQAAQQEAHTWKLNTIQVWDPTPLVRKMLARMDLDYKIVEREHTSIASALWYHEDNDIGTTPLWLNNEHYAWC